VLLRLTPLPRGAGTQVIIPPADESPLPAELRAVLEESLRQLLAAGSLTGYPLTDLEVRVVEAPFTLGDTTEIGLKAAAQRGLLLAAREAGLTLLEPVMAIELVIPADYAGKVIGTVLQKRGRVEGVESRGESEAIRALVPLAEMFGYMTELRSATKGRGTYTMEFAHFGQAPAAVLRRFGLG
jgi:elongation factor G